MQDLTANGATAGPGVGPPEVDSLARVRDHVREAQTKTAELVADMRVLLLDEQRVYDELQVALKESRGRRDHLSRALEHLTGSTERYTTKTTRSKHGAGIAGRPRTEGLGNRPRQEHLDQIVEALRKQPGMDHTRLTEAVDCSTETVTRGLRHLRAEEVVRVTGNPGQRGATYALMPEHQAAPSAA